MEFSDKSSPNILYRVLILLTNEKYVLVKHTYLKDHVTWLNYNYIAISENIYEMLTTKNCHSSGNVNILNYGGVPLEPTLQPTP